MMTEETAQTDTVGKLLSVVVDDLTRNNLRYIVNRTYPSRRTYLLKEDALYVLRQQVSGDGTILLTAGAKMGKED